MEGNHDWINDKSFKAQTWTRNSNCSFKIFNKKQISECNLTFSRYLRASDQKKILKMAKQWNINQRDSSLVSLTIICKIRHF